MIEFTDPHGRVSVAAEHIVAVIENPDGKVTLRTLVGDLAYPGTYGDAMTAITAIHVTKATLPRSPSGPRLTYANDPITDWGASIRTRRVAKGWTGEQLAERVGSTAGTVSRWENGISEPRRETKLRLAEVLEVDPHELFAQ